MEDNDITKIISRERRSKKDHLRYLRQREVRLEKQKAYYRLHRDRYREYRINRILKETEEKNE